MLLGVAILVFLMLLIGLGLTIWEFRYGQPRRESQRVKTKREAVAERHERLAS
jgi:hypothetical protein